MAQIGATMREDRPLSNTPSVSDSVNIDELMSSDAYKNDKDPNHARVSQQVQNYFKQKYPS